MVFTNFLLSALTILSLVRQASAATDAWHLDYTVPLAYEELDPIVNPNGQSSHMHQIIGGSRFGASYNYDNLVGSKCSTVRNQADNSNYWVPQLYYYDSTLPKPFTPVRASFRFYYFLSKNSPAQYVAPFPKGLRMLVGDPNSKSTSNVIAYKCQTNPQLSNPIESDNFNFNRDCPNGLKTVVYFPSCWDGLNLYKSDGSHMTYPAAGTDLRNGPCPLSHPVKVPHIQLEVGWFPSEVAPGVALAGHMVWANGDTTGYGYHADFTNGWNYDVLSTALNATGCVDTNDEIPMENCPVFTPYFNQGVEESCTPELGQLQEPTGNAIAVPIAALPGCNPVWTSGPKPGCSPAVAGLDVSAFTGTDGAYVVPDSERQDFQLPTTPGWTSIACMNSRESLLNYVEEADNALTVDRCTDSCSKIGYAYAGMGMRPTPTCICGTGIAPTGGVAPGMCTTPCPGNSTQFCGNTQVFNIYYAPNGTQPAVNSNSSYLGCLTNPSNGLIAASSYNFLSSNMSTEVCAEACTEQNSTYFFTYRGNQCYCGTNYNIGTGYYQPDDYCTYQCSGNANETCGDSYRANVYNLTASSYQFSNKAALPGYQGCYQKPSSGLALQNTTWTSSTMTVESCVDGCNVIGYKYAAVNGGKTCSCGDTTNLGSVLPSNQCNTPCAGNSNETCGASFALELYSANASTINATAVAAAHPAGWMGCYVNSGASIALSDYSYKSNSMTSALCKAACASFKYPYAGLDSANECSCGTSGPQTTIVAPSNCNTPCSGNSSESCGASSYMDVFNSTNVAVAAVNGTGVGYKGCFQDTGTKGLSSYMFKSNAMTIELCTSGCKELGYSLAALEYSTQCFCGNTWQGQLQLPETSCNMNCGGNSTQICGAGSIASLYDTTNAPAPAARTEGWLGCYTDNTSKRTLSAYSYSSSAMTVTVCRSACALKGYTLAGVENSKECYCDNALTDAAQAPTGLCSSTCAGNATAFCGGAGVLDAYNATGATPHSNGIAGFAGCFADYGSINTYSYSSDALTTYQCEQMCILKNYKYAATRNSKICQCGNSLPNTLTTTATCNMNCSGNATQTCGSATAVSVYDLSSADVTSGAIDPTSDASGFVGCFKKGSGPVLDNLVMSGSTMTNQLCTSSCAQLGYMYSGTQGGKYCYCGASLNSTTASYRVQPTYCNNACAGNATDTCGAGDAYQVYEVAKTGIAAASTNIEGYKGCYLVGNAVTTSPYIYNYYLMSASLCRRMCKNKGYSIAALNNGRNCACSNTVLYGAEQPLSLCNTACPGNSTEICGQSTYASIYNTNGPGAYPAQPSWATDYVGCFQDATSTPNNTLNGYSISLSTMSTSVCQNTCLGKGYSIFGTQGKLCYCGTAYPAAMLAESACSWNCNGNANERCGGGSALSVYDAKYAAYVPPVANTTTSANSSSSASSTASASRSANVTASTSASNFSAPASATASVNGSFTSSIASFVNSTSSSVRATSSVSANVTAIPPSMINSTASATPTSVFISASATSSKAASSSASSASVAPSSSSVISSSSAAVSSSSVASSSVSSASSSSSSVDSSSAVLSSSSSAVQSSSAIVPSSASSSSTAASSSSSFVSTSSTAPASSSVWSSSATSSSTAAASSSSSVFSASAESSSSSAAASSSSSVYSSPVSSSAASSSDVLSSSSSAASSLSSAEPTSSVFSSSAAASSSSSAVESSSSVAPSSTSSVESSSSVAATSSASSSSVDSSSASVSSSASSTSSSAASTSSSAAPPASTDAAYVGCYTQPSEIVSGVNMNCTSLTPNMCKLWCKTNNYEYSGMTGGNYCGCTNDISQLSVVSADQCGTNCIGDANAKCGGNNAFSVFKSVVDPMKVKRAEAKNAATHRRRNRW